MELCDGLDCLLGTRLLTRYDAIFYQTRVGGIITLTYRYVGKNLELKTNHSLLIDTHQRFASISASGWISTLGGRMRTKVFLFRKRAIFG